jgi:hypothetical protein
MCDIYGLSAHYSCLCLCFFPLLASNKHSCSVLCPDRSDKRRTSPYHQQTNSNAESYNRSMRKYITAMRETHPHMDWEDLLPSMMLSYNYKYNNY